MNDTYCMSCNRWTDPAILIDGDCPGCRVASPDIPITPEYLRECGFVEPEI